MSSKHKPFDKESVYDEQIAPLMTQIIKVCKEHDIPMLATFNYKRAEDGEDDFCTTCQGSDQPDEIKEALRIIRKGASTRPKFMAFTITTKNAKHTPSGRP